MRDHPVHLQHLRDVLAPLHPDAAARVVRRLTDRRVMNPTGVYRSEQGTIWRVLETDEGHLRVETLDGETWIPGRISLVGLRLASSTKRLTPNAIRALPA